MNDWLWGVGSSKCHRCSVLTGYVSPSINLSTESKGQSDVMRLATYRLSDDSCADDHGTAALTIGFVYLLQLDEQSGHSTAVGPYLL